MWEAARRDFQNLLESADFRQRDEQADVEGGRAILDTFPDAEAEPGTVCAICIDEAGPESSEKWKKVPCGHMYHQACLAELVQLPHRRSCPLCRLDLGCPGDSGGITAAAAGAAAAVSAAAAIASLRSSLNNWERQEGEAAAASAELQESLEGRAEADRGGTDEGNVQRGSAEESSASGEGAGPRQRPPSWRSQGNPLRVRLGSYPGDSQRALDGEERLLLAVRRRLRADGGTLRPGEAVLAEAAAALEGLAEARRRSVA